MTGEINQVVQPITKGRTRLNKLLAREAARQQLARAREDSIQKFWAATNRELELENPDRYMELSLRNLWVLDATDELQMVQTRVRLGKRFDDIMLPPYLPDTMYKEIKADVLAHGEQDHEWETHRHIQAKNMRPGQTPSYDFRIPKTTMDGSDEMLYRYYGIRMRLPKGSLVNARNTLILYALKSHNENLDWNVVENAADEFLKDGQYTADFYELHKLIAAHRRTQPAISLGNTTAVQSIPIQAEPTPEQVRLQKWNDVAYGRGGIFFGQKRPNGLMEQVILKAQQSEEGTRGNR